MVTQKLIFEFENENEKGNFLNLLQEEKVPIISDSKKKGGLLFKNYINYNQDIDLLNIIILSATLKILPKFIIACKEVIVKYIEVRKKSITLQNKDKKIKIDGTNIKELNKIFDELNFEKFFDTSSKD